MGEFIIVTTNTVPGYEIEKCYGYISISFVVGANWFRDLGSSITDIVGGVSEGYTEEVNSLKERAKAAIKNKARLLGLDGIIGFKIDVDPVFGSGYSMFMVSAVGTGVKIKGMGKEISKEEARVKEKLGLLYSDIEIEIDLEGVNILDVKNYELETVLLKIGLENRVGVIKKILKECNSGRSTKLSNDLVKKEILKEYFSGGDLKSVKEILLRDITECKCKIAKDLEIVDYKILLEELKKVKGEKQELALLYLLDIKLNNVSREEYLNLVELKKFLRENYSKEIEIKTSAFKKKESWICKKCNANVDIDRESCHMCGTNKYGIASRFSSEGKFISLERKIRFIEKLESLLSEVYS